MVGDVEAIVMAKITAGMAVKSPRHRTFGTVPTNSSDCGSTDTTKEECQFFSRTRSSVGETTVGSKKSPEIATSHGHGRFCACRAQQHRTGFQASSIINSLVDWISYGEHFATFASLQRPQSHISDARAAVDPPKQTTHNVHVAQLRDHLLRASTRSPLCFDGKQRHGQPGCRNTNPSLTGTSDDSPVKTYPRPERLPVRPQRRQDRPHHKHQDQETQSGEEDLRQENMTPDVLHEQACPRGRTGPRSWRELACLGAKPQQKTTAR